MSVQIRDAEPNDSERISQLIRDLGYTRAPHAVAVELATLGERSSRDRVLVALIGKAIVGFASVATLRYFHTGTMLCRITALAVADAHRGAGIGKALIASCEAHARAAGCAAMEVTSALDRHDAHCFYRHIGYSGVATKFSKSL